MQKKYIIIVGKESKHAIDLAFQSTLQNVSKSDLQSKAKRIAIEPV